MAARGENVLYVLKATPLVGRPPKFLWSDGRIGTDIVMVTDQCAVRDSSRV